MTAREEELAHWGVLITVMSWGWEIELKLKLKLEIDVF